MFLIVTRGARLLHPTAVQARAMPQANMPLARRATGARSAGPVRMAAQDGVWRSGRQCPPRMRGTQRAARLAGSQHP